LKKPPSLEIGIKMQETIRQKEYILESIGRAAIERSNISDRKEREEHG
jgi:hypothetical protein